MPDNYTQYAGVTEHTQDNQTIIVGRYNQSTVMYGCKFFCFVSCCCCCCLVDSPRHIQFAVRDFDSMVNEVVETQKRIKSEALPAPTISFWVIENHASLHKSHGGRDFCCSHLFHFDADNMSPFHSHSSLDFINLYEWREI